MDTRTLDVMAKHAEDYEDWLWEINHSIITGADPQQVMEWAESDEGKAFYSQHQEAQP
jgi:hypothetical protein